MVSCNSRKTLNGSTFIKIARQGFEPWSQDPEPRMIDRYTTGLLVLILTFHILIYRSLMNSKMPVFALDFFYLF